MKILVPFPIVIARENKWFVASCPSLDLATQGRTENEVRNNMKQLIDDYLADPDTSKPSMRTLTDVSLTNILVNVPEGVLHQRETSSSSSE